MSVRIRRSVLFLLVAAAAGACAGPGEPTSTVPIAPLVPLVPLVPVTEAAPFLISNAVSGTAASVVGSASSSLVDERAYVSAPPGTFPGMASASVRVDRTGATTAADLVDGGFDPVSVSARTGDTLTVLLVGVAGSSTTYRMTVPGKRPPIIVRTVPPQNKRDVPLNARMVVVFSEPIDARTLTAQSVSVRAGSVIVPGTLAFTTSDQTTVEFVPSGDLDGSTAYELVITEHITDRDGTALDAPQIVAFSTLPSTPALAPANMVAVSATNVTGIVGTAVSDAPAVRMSDQYGAPVVGVPVTFVAAQGTGTLATTEALTDREGVARSGGWILGQSAGRHAIFARSNTLRGKSVTFESIAVPRAVHRITPSAGDRQIAIAGTSTRFPLAVFASDTFGNAIAGIPIVFAVVSGGGTIDETHVTTNADGVGTSSPLTLGTRLGDQQVQASSAGFQTTFTVFARPPLSTCLLLNCPGSRLAFVRDGDIYSAFADGSNSTRLTRGIEPAWSVDGRIAFTGVAGVYVMNEDGSNVRLVAPGASSPAWSTASQQLAVVKRTANGQAIEVVTVDVPTTTPLRVGFEWGWNAWPTWSPEGRIAFASDAGSDALLWEVYMVDRAGAAEQGRPLTKGYFGSLEGRPSFVFDQPTWSSDGTKMALMRCPAQQSSRCELGDLVVMNADGTGMITLSATRGSVRPSWSPNGHWITFDGPSGIRYISADGRQQGLLIPNASNATWRP